MASLEIPTITDVQTETIAAKAAVPAAAVAAVPNLFGSLQTFLQACQSKL